MIPLPDLKAFENFAAASQAVLEYLQQRYGFSLWMTTRTVRPHWVVLEAADQSYGVSRGQVFNWADSFCSRMVEGRGPQIAPRVTEVPAYCAAEIGQQVPIGAYIGVPMRRPDGGLYGTLCAIDPEPQPPEIAEELPQLNLLGQLLSSQLHQELRAAEQAREIQNLARAVNHDVLTGLLNRRGWEEALRRESIRSQRYGSPIVLFVLDLDDFKLTNDTFGHAGGDELLKAATTAIASSVRASDIVARLGGDEFGVMAVECTRGLAEEIKRKLQDALAARGIRASIGLAAHEPGEAVAVTLARADQAMYEMKARHKRERLTT